MLAILHPEIPEKPGVPAVPSLFLSYSMRCALMLMVYFIPKPANAESIRMQSKEQGIAWHFSFSHTHATPLSTTIKSTQEMTEADWMRQAMPLTTPARRDHDVLPSLSAP